LDVGRARFWNPAGARRERFFVNILSAGLSGLVDLYVAETSKALGGKAAYFGASLRAILAAKPAVLRCTITTDGTTREERIRAWLVAICNGRYFGGGMQVAPMARTDDGRFDVVAIDAPSKLGFTMTSRKIYSGAHLRAPGTRHFVCEKIALEL